MKNAKLFRSVAFVLAVLVLLYVMCDLFEYNNDHSSQRIETYQHLEKDTVDVVFTGTSGMDRYWIAPKAFEENGITAYCLSTEAMPTWLLKSMLIEAEKNQSPKLVIFDMRSFMLSYDKGEINDVRSRRVIDVLDFFSMSRFNAINRTLKVLSKWDDDTSRFDPSFFLSFIRYHSRWEEEGFTFDELKDPESEYMGFFIHKELTVAPIDKVTKNYVTDERAPMDPLCEQQLYELLDYVEKKDYQVLFLDTPHNYNELEAKRMNTMCDILDEEGVDYLVCDIDEKYDFVKDFYNDGHVNYYGAEKFTPWFAQYLLSNYDLPDRRNDEDCKQWYGAYDTIKNKVAELEKSAAAK